MGLVGVRLWFVLGVLVVGWGRSRSRSGGGGSEDRWEEGRKGERDKEENGVGWRTVVLMMVYFSGGGSKECCVRMRLLVPCRDTGLGTLYEDMIRVRVPCTRRSAGQFNRTSTG